MIAKLFEHLLIWTAATASIVLGVSWAYTFGLTSYQWHLQLMGAGAALLALAFAGGLVQRSPLAITGLVLVSATALVVGVWLLVEGMASAGAGYLVVGATYVGGLGPSCLRWLTSRER